MRNCSYLLKVNTAEVTAEFKTEILKDIAVLKLRVQDLERAVERSDPNDAIAYEWLQNIIDPLDSIRNNVGRINGAVLVRGTE